MVLLHDDLAHTRAVDPIAEIHRVPASVVVRELPKADDKEVRPALVGKVVLFSFAPKVCDPAQKGPFEVVNTPEWLDADDFAVGQPCTRLSEASLWIRCLPYF